MKNDIKESVKYVASKFEYKKDSDFFIDQWFVMKDKDGKFIGDCDDFTMTCLWYFYGCSLLSFIWNVIIANKAKIYQVTDINGEDHIIGFVDGYYFDNWSMEALEENKFFEKTKHVVKMKHNFFTIWLKTIVGLFFR
jgi:hypothetical protein